MDQANPDVIARRVMSYSKNMDSKSYSGIATFFRANLAEDWRQIDIAIRDPAGEFEQFAHDTGMT